MTDVHPPILVDDDDPDQRRLLGRMPTGAGVGVATVSVGEAAVAGAFASRPDPILMEVMMPRLIVMQTTKDEAADAFRATGVGADAFMHEPVDFPLPLKTVTDFIGPA